MKFIFSYFISVTLTNTRPSIGSNAAREHQGNGDFKRNIGPISRKHWILTQKKFLHFLMCAFSLMRPARHFEFETPALTHSIS